MYCLWAGLLILALSYRPSKNLPSRQQAMNASFDPLRIVNTYGAFGSITRERYEVILEGTDATESTTAATWT